MTTTELTQFTTAPFARGATPALATPKKGHTADDLAAWAADHHDEIQELLVEHGAVFFRGFDVATPEDFEKVALAIEPGLGNEYLGTSPRNAVTNYVFSASELPGFYPIPQHCEMTFLKGAPERVLFWCEIAPESVGGETPLTDFKAVAEQMDPRVRERFARRGLRVIRNYTGPSTTSRDLWQLKPWHEMFLTEDHAEVDRICEREGFDRIWRDDDRLTLISYQPAFIHHPVTGDLVWYNHSQVFHTSTAAAELKRVAMANRDIRSGALALVSGAMMGIRKKLTPSELQPMHVTYADGEEIPAEDMEHVRDLVWENTVRERWQKNDFVVIDNQRVAHGRMPFKGPRRVLVAWA